MRRWRPRVDIKARRWRWHHWPTCCTAESCSTTQHVPTGLAAIDSFCPTVMRRSCNTHCCISMATGWSSTTYERFANGVPPRLVTPRRVTQQESKSLPAHLVRGLPTLSGWLSLSVICALGLVPMRIAIMCSSSLVTAVLWKASAMRPHRSQVISNLIGSSVFLTTTK